MTYIGARAVVLPGCKILNENVVIMPLTHIVPSEELTTGTWHGSPSEMVNIENGILPSTWYARSSQVFEDYVEL